MMAETREGRLVDTFVTLADTLVVGYDVVDLLHTLVEACANLLSASAAGIMLADSSGQLALVASTSEKSRLVELMQLSSGNGPCVESFTTGTVYVLPDVEAVKETWPEFYLEATEQGFRAVHAVPLRLRGDILGTLNLFLDHTGSLTPDDASVAQGLADVATIGILQGRAARESQLTQQQLQSALNSRVVIEQAKGVIAQIHGVDMDIAFNTLRQFARSNNLTLRDVADGVVHKTLSL
ncbi:GAF and ANTAR domain-containing protein [Lacisediminihabitans sp. FW035]